MTNTEMTPENRLAIAAYNLVVAAAAPAWLESSLLEKGLNDQFVTSVEKAVESWRVAVEVMKSNQEESSPKPIKDPEDRYGTGAEREYRGR